MLRPLILLTLLAQNPATMGGAPGHLCPTYVLQLPGSSGNYVSSPDSAATSLTSTLDIRARVQFPNYATGGTQAIIGKWGGAGTFSYVFQVSTTGLLSLFLSLDGSATTFSSGSTQNPNLVGGTAYYLRATAAIVAGTVTVKYYTCTSLLAASCTQVGSNRTGSIASIHDNASPVEVGSRNTGTGSFAVGRILYAEIRDSDDGTVVAKFDPQAATVGATSFTSSTGEVWTLNGTADVRRACVE
jgi:hypothetical protein